MPDAISGPVVRLHDHPIADDGFGADFKVSLFPQLGEKTDQVDELIFAKAGGEAGRHHRDRANGDVFDVGTSDAVHLAGVVAQDDLGVAFAHQSSSVGVAVFLDDEGGVVAFLDLVVGIEKGGDEVIDGGTGANADEVGADGTTHSADGVAGEALNVGMAIDRFSAVRVAFGLHAIDELCHILGRELLGHRFQFSGGLQGVHEILGRLAGGACPLHAEAGDFGREGFSLQGLGECGGSFGALEEAAEQGVGVVAFSVFFEESDGGGGGLVRSEFGKFLDRQNTSGFNGSFA